MTILRLATNDGPYRSPREDAAQRIAAIDIGSNSIRQIVADVSANGAIRVVDEMKAAPRLGSGLGGGNVLADEPMRLAIESLMRMATLARQLGAKRIEAVATSALSFPSFRRCSAFKRRSFDRLPWWQATCSSPRR